MKIVKTVFILIIFAFLILIYENIMAFKDGITGLTKKNGKAIGCVCHQFKPNDSVSVIIVGPKFVPANDSAVYQLKISNGPHIVGGCDIAVSLGNVYTSSLDTSLRRAEPFPGAGFELTHRYPKLFTGDTLVFTFTYVAPDTSNIVDTLFANGNSANNDTTSDNDIWNFSRNFAINITPPSAIMNNSSLVKSFELHQNYPNPFNPNTVISYQLSVNTFVTMKIYNDIGSEVATLVNQKQNAGSYEVKFDGSDYSSGVYFYKIIAGEFTDTKKFILMK